MKADTKYYNNVFIIDETNRKLKLQELFLRSIRNDIDSWSKNIKYNTEKEIKVKEINYFSGNYDGHVFQFDYGKKIGLVLHGDIYELVLDQEDYKGNKYPDKIKSTLIYLMETVFTDGVNKIDSLIPKTDSEIADDKRNDRSEKLKKLWGDKDD